tara:strand:- start:1672 stop:1884 length:213 start_codon:yes stop_codon:yes gene_type:complete
MDATVRNELNQIICPQCRVPYYPKLGDRKTNLVIQEEFPDATREEREQLVTGICSDQCWGNFVGHPPASE